MMTQHVYIDINLRDPEARPGKGSVPAKYAMVGIAPSKARSQEFDNDPFGSKTWKFLDKIKRTIEDSIYATNLVKTPVIPGKKPPLKLIRESYPGLIHELRIVNPERILALGALVAEALCPGFKDLREDHGTLFYNEDLKTWVVPTYHFSAVADSPSLNRILIRDLQRFFELPDPEPHGFNIVTDLDDINFPIDTEIFLDIETTGFDEVNDQITSLGFCFDLEVNNEIYVLPNPDKNILRRLYTIINKHDLTVVGHNLAFDLRFLWEKTGIFWENKIQDTMVLAYLVGEKPLNLKHLATYHTDRPGSRAFGSFDSFDYLSEDVISTYLIFGIFSKQLGNVFIRDLTSDLIKVLIGMKSRGVYINRSLLEGVEIDLLKEKDDLENKLLDLFQQDSNTEKINLGSPDQIVKAFQKNDITLTEKTPKGKYTVAEDVLIQLSENHPEAALLLQYRSTEKTWDTFVKAYLEQTTKNSPLLYPSLILTGARTGRLSCRKPNLQQVPRLGPIKTAFVSRWPQGRIGLVDFSQAELRVFALLSGDEKFAEMILSGDAHLEIASVLFKKNREDISAGERKKSKGVTFGLLYGGGPPYLAKKAGTSVVEVKKIMKDWFSNFPRASTYLDEMKKEGIKSKLVKTIFGRQRPLRDVVIVEGIHRAQRIAVNSPIQGTASDLNLMVLLYTANFLRREGLKSRPFMAVHDSSLLEVAEGEALHVAKGIQQGFETILDSPLGDLPLAKDIPFQGELAIGKSWAEVESTAEDYYDPDIIYPMNSLKREDWYHVSR